MFTALLRTCQVYLARDRHRHWDSLPSLYKTRCIPSVRSVSSRITAVHIEVHLLQVNVYHNASYCLVICIVFITLQSSLIVSLCDSSKYSL